MFSQGHDAIALGVLFLDQYQIHLFPGKSEGDTVKTVKQLYIIFST